ncbi:MAG: recombinase family protein [Nocardioidaceae bacterium]|nr:recombinase family protein [Nocardioidaceae bacterium]
MSPKNAARRAAIYARISVTTEESVSVERQIEAARQYAAARGWDVVATFTDEGVSATHNKPEDRAGWQALLASSKTFDAVVVWKVDRLARRVLDFLHADEALQARGAGIVAVEQTVDMTTPEGRGFATMLAVFGEMEAAAISARVAAARTYLLRNGRVVGGKVPYGFRSVPAPDGKGYVLARDPDTVDTLREMVRRTQAGHTLYSTVQWLNAEGIPTPTGKNEWVYSTVERILRHPVLAGMTPFNPGNDKRSRGTGVLHGENGLPEVNESLAVMPVGEWRAMVAKLDARDTAQSRPRHTRARTSSLLSGLVWCADCEVRMHRGTVQGRPGYSCPSCFQTMTRFEHLVIAEFLRMKGERVRWSTIVEVHEGGAAVLPEIEHRLAELGSLLQATDDDDEAESLSEQMAALRRLRREARAEAPVVEYRPTRETQMFGDDWAEATTDEERREILGDAIERIWVSRGRPGRRTDAQALARLRFDWRHPNDLGPLDERA